MGNREFSAKTVEDAIKKAMESFGVTKEELSYQVVAEPTKGFLGFGSKPAVINASVIVKEGQADHTVQEPLATAMADVAETKKTEKIEETKDNLTLMAIDDQDDSSEAIGRAFLSRIFDEMGLNTTIVTEEKEGYLVFDIQGDGLGILIGRRGDTLDALQFLLNLIINRKGHGRIKAIIDIENYRAKREETLINLSHKLAEKAKRTGQKVILEPMNPQERRIIHMTLQDDNTINTYSEGDEPYRKVIITPKKRGSKKYNKQSS